MQNTQRPSQTNRFALALFAILALFGLNACRAGPAPAPVPAATRSGPALVEPTAGLVPPPSGTTSAGRPTVTLVAPTTAPAATPPPAAAADVPPVPATRPPLTPTRTATATATPTPPVRPGQGVDTGVLSAGAREGIDALFAEWDRAGSPGCSVGLGQAGGLIYGRGYGLANIASGVPITVGTTFNAGSIAKQVTALAVELLREEGRVRLDDDLAGYVPELPPYAAGVTLRQMLNHTSGLRDDRTLALMAGVPDDELLTRSYLLDLIFRQQDTNFPPGRQFSYSNSNYSLLALVVERAGGQTIEQFARDRLFAPLGMARTRFLVDPMAPAGDEAIPYVHVGRGYQISLPNAAIPGPTNLYTTVSDLVRWADNYSTAQVGSREGLAAMLQPARDAQGRLVAYNFGIEQLAYRGVGAAFGHDGRDGGFRSALLFWPEQRRAVAVLCNVEDVDAEKLAEQAARIWLGLPALTPTPRPTPRPTAPSESYITLPPADLAALSGVYYDPDKTHLVTLSLDGDRLAVKEQTGVHLVPLAPDRFRIFVGGSPTPGSVRFLPGGGMKVENTLTLNGSYRRYPDLSAGPDYTGTYYSPDLDATYRISLRQGVLTLNSRRFVNIALLPADESSTADGRFEMAEALPPITVEFSPAVAGASAPGFALSLDRARGVRFDRAH